MNCMMMGGGVAMWAMGLIGLLIAVVLVFAAAALGKYLFLSKPPERAGPGPGTSPLGASAS